MCSSCWRCSRRCVSLPSEPDGCSRCEGGCSLRHNREPYFHRIRRLDLWYWYWARPGLYFWHGSEPRCGSELYTKTQRLGHYAWIPGRLCPEQRLSSYVSLVWRHQSGCEQFQCCNILLRPHSIGSTLRQSPRKSLWSLAAGNRH